MADSEGRKELSVVGLFSGVGGVEQGLRGAGHHALQLWELMPEAQACLREHFPGTDVPKDGDITRPGFAAALPERFDVLTAGFPCQDLSQAGRTAGIKGAKSGLIVRVFDVLTERKPAARPSWVLLENVPFMRHLSGGEAMKVVLGRLTDLGYHWAYRLVDSNAFGLPQRRKRLYFAACKPDAGDPRAVLFADDAVRPQATREPAWQNGTACGFYWTEGNRGIGWGHDLVPALKVGSSVQVPSPPAILHPDEGVIKPSIEDAEALQGFKRGWTAPAKGVGRDRNGRWRWYLVGNAVSVPVARWIGERIAQPVAPLVGLMDGARPLPEEAGWPMAAFRLGKGQPIHRVPAKDWPVEDERLATFGVRRVSLMELLAEGNADERAQLSFRATRGFRTRLADSSLLVKTAGELRKALLDRLLAHEQQMAAAQG